MSRRRRAMVAALALPLGLTAAGAAPAAAMPAAAVVIQGYAFAPANLTVNVGDTITWTNKDTAAHDVTSAGASGPLRSPRLVTGQSYTASFPSAGTFRYVCTIHPDMTATVVVRAAVTTTAVPVLASAAGKAVVESQSSELFAPSLGMVVYQVVRTATPQADGSTATTTSTAELLADRPV